MKIYQRSKKTALLVKIRNLYEVLNPPKMKNTTFQQSLSSRRYAQQKSMTKIFDVYEGMDWGIV